MLRLLTALCCCVLIACGEAPDTGEALQNTAAEKSANDKVLPRYIELGDLDALKKHKIVRLIAPRFDGADALPREGISVRGYQQLAERFVDQLGMTVQWVFVDDFEQLIPTLNAGQGDMIVTNLAVTDARRQQVSFGYGINQVDEVIVSQKVINALDDIQGMSISVPSGTSYVSALQKLLAKNPERFRLQLLASSTSDADVLDSLAAGEFEASVLDSDITRQLLGKYPNLKVGPKIKQHRSIAWAVRRGNEQLLSALNQFLVAHHVTESARQFDKRSWPQIQKSGRLRVLTLNNPASYFMWRGDLMGFDYDLMRKFAQQFDLHLSIVMKDSIDELFDAIKSGEGDVIAASITRSDERVSKGLLFSDAYLKVEEALVGMESGPSVDSLQSLSGLRVGVNPETVFYRHLVELKDQNVDVELVEFPGVSTEQLIQKMEAGEFDFTLADSHLIALEKVHNSDLSIKLTLDKKSDIAWVLRPEQIDLKSELDAFIRAQYKGLFYNVTFNKYFKNKRTIKRFAKKRMEPGQALSPYDKIVQPLAQQYGMDWRLVISQMYQESRFNPKAKSFAGAQGLMQVVPRTAREMGYSNVSDPQQGIEAGMAYMNWLKDRFPGEMNFHDRLYFTLAAYNAGAGHVRDARRLAEKLGLDPDRWFDHTEKAMLLLSQAVYHKQARFGYVRGSEPVQYVRQIRDRYLGYLAVTGE